MRDCAALTCEDCNTPLGPAVATFYEDTVLSCGECLAVWQITCEPTGLALAFVGAPCGYCGRLTDDGGPCDAPCGDGGPHSVNLEEVAHGPR